MFLGVHSYCMWSLLRTQLSCTNKVECKDNFGLITKYQNVVENVNLRCHRHNGVRDNSFDIDKHQLNDQLFHLTYRDYLEFKYISNRMNANL